MGSDSKGRLKACTEVRISGLPDEILCHILSFLGTDVAVKTSILSHGWKNVWTKVPTIEKVLTAVALWDLWIMYCYRMPQQTSINSIFIVPNLSNILGLMLGFALPLRVMLCKTLVVLRLRLISVITITPTSDCFPSLKVLHLTVCHPDTDSMEKLISCYPVLEDLIIVGSLQEFSYLEFNISALKLKSLLIFLEPFGSDYKYNISVNINAPDLENFEIRGEVLATYSLNNSKSLSKAKINFGALHMFEDLDDDDVLDSTVCVHELFAELLKVKDLSLSAQFLGDPRLMRQYHLPTFANLIHLELFLHRH